ncbi:carboxymuconolactone decarboxylase family protein [Acidithiobacillus sp.]|uniref:carboxymuconolactone decarboxylase family protein n=1 Tax=Acidithiobacillus sp. TaxID=1872118 RepID=UPI003D07A5FD
MSDASRPSPEQIFAGMRQAMGHVPSAIEKSVDADAELIHEHMRSRAFAMPTEGALDDETRTLVYLAAALAGSSHACIQAMAKKAAHQKIPAAKVMETVRIVRYAMATKVVGDAEPVFAALGARD